MMIMIHQLLFPLQPPKPPKPMRIPPLLIMLVSLVYRMTITGFRLQKRGRP